MTFQPDQALLASRSSVIMNSQIRFITIVLLAIFLGLINYLYSTERFKDRTNVPVNTTKEMRFTLTLPPSEQSKPKCPPTETVTQTQVERTIEPRQPAKTESTPELPANAEERIRRTAIEAPASIVSVPECEN
jgi:cytoskeletal protein RodZ